jgi:hypothetical protein
MKNLSESTFVQHLDPIVEHFLGDSSEQCKCYVRHKLVTPAMVADAGEATFANTSLSLYPLDLHRWPSINIPLSDM